MSRTAGRPSPGDVAARLWPEPDPVNYAKRQAIARLAKLDRALNSAIELRTSADELIFPGRRRRGAQGVPATPKEGREKE